MSFPAVLFALLVGAALWFVLAPVLRRARGSGSENGERERLEREKVAALGLLKDLEFDRQTGKLSQADYDALRADAEEHAIQILRALDGLRGPERWDDAELEARIAGARRRRAGRA